jgi:cellulose synthase/poly-beta-1,6-N-acetylglucosamine synthase-like glycosyltransferase
MGKLLPSIDCDQEEMNTLFIPVALLYFLVTGLLFLYGVNFLYVTYLSLRNGPRDKGVDQKVSPLPKVTIQLPIYNEMYVAQRLVTASTRLDYPKHLLEIQVLDDSTDETFEIVKRTVAAARQRGVDIKHLHRKYRDGYKAGALRDGFASAKGEFIAIFDADFLPPITFLRQTLPQFNDPKVAFVQTRWGHLNRDFSFLTLLQSLAIDAHFMVEQLARSRTGYWFNFNGTAGIWRRQAIEEAGGWKADTLTEDLDLSYRAFLKGWKANFLSNVETPAELPITFNGFRRQQHRWARGSLECAIRLLPKVWASDAPLKTRIQATFHLTGYGVHLLLLAYSLIYPLVIVLSKTAPGLISLFGIAHIFSLTALAPTLLFISGQYQLRKKWSSYMPLLLVISGFGAGMMLNTARAAWEIIRGRPGEFRRTPKFGVENKTSPWTNKKYHLRLDPIVFWELIFAALNLYTMALGIQAGYWLISFYAGLFAFGFAFTSIYTIYQTVMINRIQSLRSAELPVHN